MKASDADAAEVTSRFLSVSVSAADSFAGCPPAESACMFCMDRCVSACMAISDMADFSESGPIPTFCDSRIPGWVGSGVDAIIVSEGRDSDAARALYDALSVRGCRVHLIASNVSMLANRTDGAYVEVPSGLDSTEAVAFVLGTLCAIVSDMGLFDARSALRDSASSVAQDRLEVLEAIDGEIIGVYSTTDVRAASRRWADLIKEKIGIPSFSGELPEFDHNELVGWSDPNVHSPGLGIVVLRSCPDGSMPSIIVGHMLEVLEENGRAVTIVDIGSGTPLERDIRSMILGEAAVRRSV